MRSDYAFYAIAIIFFILSGIALAYRVELAELWTVATVVLGLLFIVLGYSQRAKPTTTETSFAPTTPTMVTEEEPDMVMKPLPTTVELTEVKGIGEKRKEQLKSIGINSVQKLLDTSAEDLAARLDISSKLTRRWIENAKKLAEEY